MDRKDEEALADVMWYAQSIGKRYFKYGEEIGEAVRGRAVESIARNYAKRGHVTDRKEVHTILRRCYVDEVRYRFGSKHKKRAHNGATYELNDRVASDPAHSNDGGIDDVIVRVTLHQEADRIEEEWRESGRAEGMRPDAIIAAVRGIADADPTATMKEIAEAVGVSLATVSRACSRLELRLAK